MLIANQGSLSTNDKMAFNDAHVLVNLKFVA